MSSRGVRSAARWLLYGLGLLIDKIISAVERWLEAPSQRKKR